MKTFNDIAVGDMLLKKGRYIGYNRYQADFQEWVAVKVDKVTRVFYHIEGETTDRRKDANGHSFMGTVYIPGENGVPLAPTDESEYEKHYQIFKAIQDAPCLAQEKLKAIKDKEHAAVLAKKLKALWEEIEEARNA